MFYYYYYQHYVVIASITTIKYDYSITTLNINVISLHDVIALWLVLFVVVLSIRPSTLS